jgi:hypothetical protein
MEKKIDMAAPVLLKSFQLKRTTAAFSASPRPDQLQSPFKIGQPLACAKLFSGYYPTFLIGFSEFKLSYALG